MTQQERQLVFNDLCARLPHGVKVYYSDTVPVANVVGIRTNGPFRLITIEDSAHKVEGTLEFPLDWENRVKPYLRSMLSMTDEERREYRWLIATAFNTTSKAISDIIDFVNTHHLDHHGLIEKDLALPATKGMYNNK